MNLNRFFPSLFISVTLLCACNQEEEHIYSCDKNINEWVCSHLDRIHSMDRKEWLKTNQKISKAVYSAFTPNQKYSFWLDKFQELKKIAWTKDELTHIKKVERFIITHKDLFGDTKLTDDQLDVLESFFYNWVKEAKEKLSWDKSMCIAIAGSGNMVLNRNGEQRTLPDSPGGGMLENCNCNTGIFSDFCGTAGSGICEDKNCSGSDFGCGWIWLQDCNGTCIPY